MMKRSMLVTSLVLLAILFAGGNAAVILVKNQCKETIWPGLLPPADGLMEGGFELRPGSSQTLHPPPNWSGRLWGRTGCKFDGSGKGACETGDCGKKLKCGGAGGAPPVSLVEITMKDNNNFYDVSIVDGFNLPVNMVPVRGHGGNCTAAGQCRDDLRRTCPSELAVKGTNGHIIACKSACMAFNTPEYCCTGAHAQPTTCSPTTYSKIFKKACPSSYSYAYDDPSSVMTCSGSDFDITFCPRRARQNGPSSSSAAVSTLIVQLVGVGVVVLAQVVLL